MKKRLMLIVAFVLALSVSACSAPVEKEEETVKSEPAAVQAEDLQTKEQRLVTIKNGTRVFEMDYIPETVLSTNMQMTEIMLKLGLEDKLIGTCYTNAEPMPEIAEAFNAIPLFSEKYPSHEATIGADPDFIVTTVWGLREDRIGTIAQLNAADIDVYASEGTLHNYEKIDQVYDDILNLGIIFDVQDRANALVEEMQTKIAHVQEVEKTILPKDKATVFVCDSINDENLIFTSGTSMANEVIKLAGGINVCEDIVGKAWGSVSVEVLIDTNPDYILFLDYGSTPVEDKIAAITGNEALADLECVKNETFITLSLQDVNESVRNANTVETLAKVFYPDIF